MAARSSYGVAAQPGCAARASAAALRTSAAVALPTLVILAPVAGSTTSSDPPAALRHSVPKTRPRQVSSMRNFTAGAFIAMSLPGAWPLTAGLAQAGDRLGGFAIFRRI